MVAFAISVLPTGSDYLCHGVKNITFKIGATTKRKIMAAMPCLKSDAGLHGAPAIIRHFVLRACRAAIVQTLQAHFGILLSE